VSDNEIQNNRRIGRKGRLVCTTGFGQDGGELVDLSLGALHGTQPLLRQFLRLFILVVSEQFHHSSFVRSEPSDFSNNTPDE